MIIIIDNAQKNSECMLCDDSDEIVNHIISKLVQKEYKSTYDWVHRELCKRLKFGHADKWYMHKPEYVIKNETHGFFVSDFKK